MNGSNIDALIIDFGGVLTTPLQDAMAVFAESQGIELQDLVRVALGLYTGTEDRLVHDFETGAISEEDFAKGFAARLQEASGVRVSPEGLVQRMFAVDLEEDMLSAVGAVKAAGFKTALLSNSWGSSLYPRARLAVLFDALVISGEVGMRKPDPRHLRAGARTDPGGTTQERLRRRPSRSPSSGARARHADHLAPFSRGDHRGAPVGIRREADQR